MKQTNSTNMDHGESLTDQTYLEEHALLLDHTDEIERMGQRLEQLVSDLPFRRLMIDAGVGEGNYFSRLNRAFDRAIGIEPNPYYVNQLRAQHPHIDVRHETIMEADIPPESADFVLCTHVFYHIPAKERVDNLGKLASWLSPDGMLVAVWGHPESDACRIYRDFYHQLDIDTAGILDAFRNRYGSHYEVEIEKFPAMLETQELNTAIAMADFLLQPPPTPTIAVPARRDVEAYICEHWASSTGYQCSSDEVFILIRRRG